MAGDEGVTSEDVSIEQAKVQVEDAKRVVEGTRTEADRKAQGARDTAARARVLGRRIFLGVNLAIIVLSVLKIGFDSDWAFLGDFGKPWAEAHWGAWRDLLVVLVGGTAAASALSFSFTYFRVNSVLNQLITDYVTHIHLVASTTNRITNHVNQITNNHNSTTNKLDPSVKDEVSRMANLIKALEDKLDGQQRNPLHEQQLKEFLAYAQSERIAELKAQLREDAKLFDKVRETLDALTIDCEATSAASRRFAE